MIDKIKRAYGKNLLNIPLDSREALILLEIERISKNFDEEQFLAERLNKSGIERLIPVKKTNTKDGGVDFAIKIKDQIIIGQLKWWRKPISKKQAKEIFGNMYLNEVALKNTDPKIEFVLVAPILNRKLCLCKDQFAQKNYNFIDGTNFVRFLTNPYYFMNRNGGYKNVS